MSDLTANEPRPKLRLTFTGDGFRDGAVPLTVVATKLQSLQQAMFHAVASVVGHAGARKGQWSNRFRPYAELTFASAHHSDLAIEAELGVNPSNHEDFSVGLKAVDLLFEVAVAVDRDETSALTVRRDELDFLLRSIEGLMPNVGDQYCVRFENCRPDADRREDALADLHENYAYQFREIAEEPRENLDTVAQAIRSRLLAIVIR